GDWKLLSFANDKAQKHLTYSKGKGKYRLYNLAKDPGEKKDLSQQEADRLKSMLARLDAIKTAGRSRP
ncbi:MAG: hypothetical protein OER86_10655, partial [Phycisphaerae bacterium]|nr:hypothetical protein [Phycisphaerae bacterium]